MEKKYKLIPASPEESIQDVQIERLELAKDKRHILVFNIDVGNISPDDVHSYIEKTKEMLRPYPEGCITYFIPHRGEPTTKIYKIDLSKELYDNNSVCECGGDKLKSPHSTWCPKYG